MNKQQQGQVDHYLNRDLQSIKGEKWKPIKDFEEYYEVSNFGRVKAYPRFREVVIPKRGTIRYWTKEMIMKPSFRKEKNNFTKDYMHILSITLNRDKQYYVFMLGRLVYYHFSNTKQDLKKGVVILHYDGNNLNNHIENLYIASYSDMHKKTYRQKRKKSYLTNLNPNKRKVLVRKSSQSRLQPVTQYSIDGDRIGFFKSLKAAAKKTGIDDGSISSALNGRYVTAGGFVWKKGEGVEHINTKKIIALKKKRFQHLNKAVEQYSLQGKKIGSFKSITLAAQKVGGSARQLRDALNGRSLTSYGYVWKFVK
jgi:hypothetical protein